MNCLHQVISDTELQLGERLDYARSEKEAMDFVICCASIFCKLSCNEIVKGTEQNSLILSALEVGYFLGAATL